MEFGLRTGSGRLFQTDGPATAKAWRRLYVLVGDLLRAVDFAQWNGDVSGWTVVVADISCGRPRTFQTLLA